MYEQERERKEKRKRKEARGGEIGRAVGMEEGHSYMYTPVQVAA